MPPKYKLTYFQVTGRAEISRLMFAAAGVQYEDLRIKVGEWPTYKPKVPQNQLPILEIDGKTTISQSQTIARHIAREFKFYGKNNLEATYVDLIFDTFQDLLSKAMPYLNEDDNDKKAEMRAKYQAEEVPKFLGYINDIIETSGKDGFAVSSSLSLADFVIHGYIDFIELNHFFEKFPKVGDSFRRVEANSKVAKYLKERPKNAFNRHVKALTAEDFKL